MTDLEETHVVTCFLRSGGDVLLLQRSDEVGSYAGAWGAVAGHAEGNSDQAARGEISEETGFDDAKLVRRGEPFPVVDAEIGKKWIVHPYLFDVERREPRLNWESSAFEWTSPTAILRREAVPRLWDSYAAIAPSLDEVRRDREHGSAYISLRALEVLRDRAATDASWDSLCELAENLIEARRSMAVLRNRVNRVMYRSREEKDVETHAHRVIEESIAKDRLASAKAARLIAGKTVMTLSRSGTVTRALVEAKPRVYVAESRPGGEGTDIAEQLVGNGVNVTLLPDSAMASAPDFDLVIVGADTVLPNGDLVNKVGTHVAALVAAARSVPFYVLTSFDKILIKGEADLEEAEWAPIETVELWAPLFELTPARLIEGFVPEHGVISTGEIDRHADELNALAAWR